MTDTVAWLILLPLAWASVAFLLGPGRGERLACAGLMVQLALAASMAHALADGDVHVHAIGGWDAPLGIELRADGLAAAMLLLTQLIALPVVFYARAYFADHAEGSRYFWPLTGYLVAARSERGRARS